jgi:pimeloyl-ACP methyl ester carboxylesterase
MRLSYEFIHTLTSSKTNLSRKFAVFLHGIFGNKKNMRTMAREFGKLRPDYALILLDHRGHGESMGRDHQSSSSLVQDCVHDLFETFHSREFINDLKSENCFVSDQTFNPQLLIGHSFGGKVVLEYLKSSKEQKKAVPSDSWILDSIPFRYPNYAGQATDDQSVFKVLNLLQKAPATFPTRNAAVEYLQVEGKLSVGISQWLAANMTTAQLSDTQSADTAATTRLRFALDLQVIESLFEDFKQLDYTSFLSDTTSTSTTSSSIHFVRAGKNKLWEIENCYGKLQSICEEQRRIKLISMADVGHWLHAERPQEVALLMHKHSNHSYSSNHS